MAPSTSKASETTTSSDAGKTFAESSARFYTLSLRGPRDQKTIDEMVQLLNARAESLNTLESNPSLRPGVLISETMTMIEKERGRIAIQYESLATQASMLGKEMPAPDGALATVVNRGKKDTP